MTAALKRRSAPEGMDRGHRLEPSPATSGAYDLRYLEDPKGVLGSFER